MLELWMMKENINMNVIPGFWGVKLLTQVWYNKYKNNSNTFYKVRWEKNFLASSLIINALSRLTLSLSNPSNLITRKLFERGFFYRDREKIIISYLYSSEGELKCYALCVFLVFCHSYLILIFFYWPIFFLLSSNKNILYFLVIIFQ